MGKDSESVSRVLDIGVEEDGTVLADLNTSIHCGNKSKPAWDNICIDTTVDVSSAVGAPPENTYTSWRT